MPTYAHKKEHSTTMVELRPPKRMPDDDYLLSKEEEAALWALITGKDVDGAAVAHMSPIIGDVVMAMLMQYLGAQPDSLGWMWISAERILEYRGIRKKIKDGYTAGHQVNELEALAACINQLENFWVKTQEWQDGKRLYAYHSRFLLVKKQLTQKELTGDDNSPARAVAWQFQPGDWYIAFRDGTRRMFAEMFAQCLQYDAYHERWECRLSKYITVNLRIDASNGNVLKRRVGALIEELSLNIDKAHPEQAFQRFKKAMDRMVKDGIIAKWYYKDRQFEQNRKPRGWLADWLNQVVYVMASDDTSEEYQGIAAKTEQRRERAEALKTARQNRVKKGGEKTS